MPRRYPAGSMLQTGRQYQQVNYAPRSVPYRGEVTVRRNYLNRGNLDDRPEAQRERRRELALISRTEREVRQYNATNANAVRGGGAMTFS